MFQWRSWNTKKWAKFSSAKTTLEWYFQGIWPIRFSHYCCFFDFFFLLMLLVSESWIGFAFIFKDTLPKWCSSLNLEFVASSNNIMLSYQRYGSESNYSHFKCEILGERSFLTFWLKSTTHLGKLALSLSLKVLDALSKIEKKKKAWIRLLSASENIHKFLKTRVKQKYIRKVFDVFL